MTKYMPFTNNLSNFSFWENHVYFNSIDLIVIGSGIVGLSAAISFKEKYPNSNVLVLERGVLPQGASTKNAGFACFGSTSELISDLKNSGEDLVWQTVEMRIKGLELLRKRIGDKHLSYKEYGGYELFKDSESFDECANIIEEFNKKIRMFTKDKNTYRIKNKHIKKFGFNNVKGLIFNTKEGQINTGKMMQNLILLAYNKGINVLNSINVSEVIDKKNSVSVYTSIGELSSKKVIIATNGFANELLKLEDVKPARAQVLITKPINSLKFKGTFHYEEGYYYFRNIGNRVLFGGGRNLDFETETTTKFELNKAIQSKLETILKDVILPKTKFEIEHRWTGIMGVGREKKPIIKKITQNIVCAIRMGGMGVAIGSLVGQLGVEEFDK